MSVPVKTECPYCGYRDCYNIFTNNRCRGNCGHSYIAMPLTQDEKDNAIKKAETLLERIRAIPIGRIVEGPYAGFGQNPYAVKEGGRLPDLPGVEFDRP